MKTGVTKVGIWGETVTTAGGELWGLMWELELLTVWALLIALAKQFWDCCPPRAGVEGDFWELMCQVSEVVTYAQKNIAVKEH